MAVAVKLKDAERGRQGLLLDSNVLPHFLSNKDRQILQRLGVGLKAAPRRFEAVKARFERRLFTSIVNVVECMAEHVADVPVATQLVSSFCAITTAKGVLCPRPAETQVLSLYAKHGTGFLKSEKSQTGKAAEAIDVIELTENVWSTAEDAQKAILLLRKLVEWRSVRDRGWPDVYTAQTAIDHNLIVLTEDLVGFRDIDRVAFLTEYDLSET